MWTPTVANKVLGGVSDATSRSGVLHPGVNAINLALFFEASKT